MSGSVPASPADFGITIGAEVSRRISGRLCATREITM